MMVPAVNIAIVSIVNSLFCSRNTHACTKNLLLKTFVHGSQVVASSQLENQHGLKCEVKKRHTESVCVCVYLSMAECV